MEHAREAFAGKNNDADIVALAARYEVGGGSLGGFEAVRGRKSRAIIDDDTSSAIISRYPR